MEIALLAGEGNAQILNMVLIFGMMAVFYFFILRPQSKKRKELEEMREALGKGDKVLANGIYGKILKIDGDEVTIEIEEGKMKVHKNFIEALPEVNSTKEEKS